MAKITSLTFESASSQNNSAHGQDAFLLSPDIGLFAVADGTSNFDYSKEASDFFTSELGLLARNCSLEGINFSLPLGFTYLNRLAKEDKTFTMPSSTTLCPVLVSEEEDAVTVDFMNAGDSTGALFIDDKLHYRTPLHHSLGSEGAPVLSTFFSTSRGLIYFEHEPRLDRLVFSRAELGSKVLSLVLMTDGVSDAYGDLSRIGRDIVTDSTKSVQETVDELVDGSGVRDDKTAIVIRLRSRE